MPVVEANYESKDEEIDLLKLLKALIKYLIDYRVLLLSLLIAGLLGGYLAYRLLPPAYKVTMIADSKVLSSIEIISITESWHDLLEKKERALLARQLNLSEATVSKLKDIEADLTNKKFIGSAPDDDPFIITATVSDNTVLDSLQAGIIYYLENNRFVKERVMMQRQNLDSLRHAINGQIADLNQMKKSIQQLIENGGTPGRNGNMVMAEPGAISGLIVDLYGKRLEIDEEIRFLDEIQVIQDFTPFNKPDSPKLSICLVIGLATGLFAAILVIVTRNIKRQLQLQ